MLAKIAAAAVISKGDSVCIRLPFEHTLLNKCGYFSRPRRDDRERRGPPMGRRPPGFRIFISGISRDTSWQVRICTISSTYQCTSDFSGLRVSLSTPPFTSGKCVLWPALVRSCNVARFYEMKSTFPLTWRILVACAEIIS